MNSLMISGPAASTRRGSSDSTDNRRPRGLVGASAGLRVPTFGSHAAASTLSCRSLRSTTTSVDRRPAPENPPLGPIALLPRSRGRTSPPALRQVLPGLRHVRKHSGRGPHDLHPTPPIYSKGSSYARFLARRTRSRSPGTVPDHACAGSHAHRVPLRRRSSARRNAATQLGLRQAVAHGRSGKREPNNSEGTLPHAAKRPPIQHRASRPNWHILSSNSASSTGLVT